MDFNGINLDDKQILLRADLNVPMKNGKIKNDFRLNALLPTIKDILNRNGRITLLTHIGRPKGVDPLLSTSHLLPWFNKHKISAAFAKNFEEAFHHIKEKKQLTLFENIRFFNGEQSSVLSDRKIFCKKLSRLGKIFINDAFGVLHRNDASITLLPLFFSEDKRALGPLVRKEIQAINEMKSLKSKPLLCIVGGKKIATKLAACAQLSGIADCLVIGPALSFTCMKAQGFSVGSSLIDTSQLATAEETLEKIYSSSMKVYLPEDYQVSNDTFPGKKLYTVSADKFPEKAVGVTIGEKSIKTIQMLIKESKSVFYTGLIGSTKTNEALSATYNLFLSMIQSKARTMIAGGDSVEAAQITNISEKISYLSTGGSSALIYLATEDLPGLAPFI